MNGVVFDCDGVLADSEPLSGQAWTDVMADFGIEVDEDDIRTCAGTTSRDTYAHFGKRGELAPYPEILAAVDHHRHLGYYNGLQGFDDAINAVKALAMVGVPLAVASSSSRMSLDIKLEVLDLARYFEVTVAEDEVEHGKPAPDLYRDAAKRLGIEVASSVAVEDTAVGADSAAAAGLRTVIVNRMGLPTGSHPVVSEVDADLLLLWLGRS